MENIERVLIPLTIGGAVLGIWAALRGSGSSPTIVESSGASPLQLPQIAPLGETLVDPAGLSGSDAGAAPSRGYTNAGYRRPQRQAPIGPSGTLNGTGLQGTPAYAPSFDDGLLPNQYTSQMAPWLNGQLAAIAAAAGWTPASTQVPTPGAAGCGCGGSCNGGKSGKCPNSQNCASLMDGGGAGFLPLYASPIAAPAAWGNGLVYSVETQIPSPAAVAPHHGDNQLSPAGY